LGDRLLWVALACSVVGLLLIAYISPSLKPPLSKVSDVSASMLERVVRVEGAVSRTHVFKGGSMMLTLTEGDSSLDVYLPYDTASQVRGVELTGRVVELTGVVQLYKGRLEVVVERPGDMRLK
jgi:DNA/RNA endonuclease YhcR with UshA esterase domain